jgi:ubiquinone biosynthesis protein
MILSPRYIPKLAAIIGLFTRYGLREFAGNQGLLELGEAEASDEQGSTEEAEQTEKARAFRERLVELGPAYVKLGQVLSTRPDLLPETYIRELEHLQDNVGAIPFSEVAQTIEKELGGGNSRLSNLFQTFDEEPLATASLGQVHAATLRDGREVVVKVQRPGIREQLQDDLEFFRELAQFLTEHTKTGARIDMVGVVQQVERALTDELDYRTEARNVSSFRRNLVEFPHIVIPRVIEAYTTSRVLTTERVHGRKIDEIPPVSRLELDFTTLADELAKAYLKQITVDGHFHADPHPGNIFVILPKPDEPKEDPKLALIDFGMTGHLTESLRDSVVKLLLDIAENRGDEAAATLIELGQPLREFDRNSYVSEISAVVAQNADQSIENTKAGLVLYEMMNTAYKFGLKLPAELTLLAKTIFNLDAITRELDPSFNASQAIRDYTSEIANQRARRDFSPRRLFQIASETSALLRALPHRVDVITERMAANDYAFRIDTPQLPTLIEGMQKIANRVFTGLVLAGLLVASGQLLPYWRKLGIAGFIIAAAIGMYMVITILIADRKKKQ